jgi:FkbM family methyltransferase
MRTFARPLLRRVLENFLESYDYELKEKSKPLRRTDRFLSYVKKYGFRPNTIIDIGVGYGTEWLYASFPEAHMILVEANRTFAKSMQTILMKFRGEAHFTAVGGSIGNNTMLVNSVCPTSSSLVKLNSSYRQQLIEHNILKDEYKITVDITTLDSMKFERLEQPILMKLDIEGSEMEALQGGHTLLSRTEMLIVELSVTERFEGAPSCAEFLSFLEASGFAMFDVVDLSQLGADGPLVSMDLAFLREDSQLWSSV